MKEDGGGWALPFLLTPLSFLAPMGSLRVSQCSSSILSPFLGQSLRAPWRAVPLMLGVGPAGEGLPACPPDPKAFDHGACWHRQPRAVFAHQTSPSDKPRRELRVLQAAGEIWGTETGKAWALGARGGKRIPCSQDLLRTWWFFFWGSLLAK